MASPYINGTLKGYIGNLNSYTGLVIESEDYDYKANTILPFYNSTGATCSVAQGDEVMNVSLKGWVLNGTTWTGTLASTLSLSAMPAYLKAGNTGGTTIIESIKLSNNFKDWRKIEIGGTYYPEVS